MPSKIQVDQIAGATGSTVTLPSGQTLDLSSGTVTLPSTALSALNATNLTSGTVPNARLSGITADKLDLISTASVPSITAKGTPSVSDGYIQLNCEQNSHGIKIKSPPHSAGATYTMVMPSAIGTSNQVLRMNSGATALEFGTVSSNFVSANYYEWNTRTSLGSSSSDQQVVEFTTTLSKTNASSYFHYFITMPVDNSQQGTQFHYLRFIKSGGGTTDFNKGSGYIYTGQSDNAHFFVLNGRTTALDTGTYTLRLFSASNGTPNNGGHTYNPNAASDDSRNPSGGQTTTLTLFEVL